LPFVDETEGQAPEYLTESFTAELINGLRLVGGLNAIRPRAALVGKSEEDIHRELFDYQVPLLVEGRVKRVQGQLRITSRLVDTGGQGELFSTSYLCATNNVLGIPNDLALRIAERSGVKLTREDRARLGKKPTSSPAAYDAYLHARFELRGFVARPGVAGTTAIQLLEAAVQWDPDFAAAFAQLGRAYVAEYFYNDPAKKSSLEGKAKVAIERALQLDRDLADAHFAMGYFHWTPSQGWDHTGAIRELARALELSPYWDEAQDQLILVYLHVGLMEAGTELANRAVRDNPLNPLTQYMVANALFWQCKYQEAENTWKLIPKDLMVNFVENSYRAVALINLGRTNEAERVIDEAAASDPQAPRDRGGLFASAQALLLAKQGRKAEAMAKIQLALQQQKGFGHFHHALYVIASAYALMNQEREALQALEDVAQDGFPCYPLFRDDSNLDSLRRTTEFKRFLAKQEKLYNEFEKEFGKSSAGTR
jgi:TolB-like protein